ARVDASLKRCPRRHVMCASKGYPRRHVMRASKGYPHRPPCARPKRILASATSYARLPMARVKDARVGHIIPASAFTRVGQRWPRLLRRVQRCTRRLLLAPKKAVSKAVTGLENWSCCLHLSSHVLPHDEEQREEGVWL